jgi:hypothetical protein
MLARVGRGAADLRGNLDAIAVRIQNDALVLAITRAAGLVDHFESIVAQ